MNVEEIINTDKDSTGVKFVKKSITENCAHQRSEAVSYSHQNISLWLLTFYKQCGISAVLLILFLCSCFARPVSAQGPENVLVVVNAESQDSLAIANKYVELRDIPASNVVYLRGITNLKDFKHGEGATLSRNFKTQILDPVLEAIKTRGLDKQIDCIAYSAGFPTRVNFNRPELQTYLKQTGQKYSLMRHGPWSSITSFTYLHRKVYTERPDFLEFDANHYANPRRMKLLANPFTGKDGEKFDSAMKDVKNRDFAQANKKFNELGREHRGQMAVVYATARCLSFEGKIEKAITMLEYAKKLGLAYRSVVLKDEAFAAIRTEPRFTNLVKDMEDLPNGIHPTRSFSSQKYWAKNGWANGNADQGERYMLSSVLAVTGQYRSTLEASLTRLESSAGADGSSPDGNVYFSDCDDVRARCRRGQFPFAVAELKSLGRPASIGKDPYPVNDDRVIGVTLGKTLINWDQSKSSYLPGAICDNLTSSGAIWTGPNQTKLTRSLDFGAAGATGTVYEPYTIQAKFPTARWHAHYARGATLVDSFFQSVAGPFQLLLVGDPLCCPFGKFPKFEISGLENDTTVTEDFLLKINLSSDSTPVKRFEVFYDGVFFAKVTDPEKFTVAIDRMDDGYHEMRIVAVSDSPIATRRSKKVGFFVNRKRHKVTLEIKNAGDLSGGTLEGLAASTTGNKVQILQNMRTIATVENEKRFSIPAASLGMGKTKLQALAYTDLGAAVRSRPVPVSLVAFTTPATPQQQQNETSETETSLTKPPSSGDLKKAVASIRNLLKDQYRDGSPDGRKNLLTLLQKTASESTNDPVNHFALLSECVHAASVFGDVEAGWSACNQIESNYDVDDLPHLDFIRRIKSKLSPESATNLYSKGIALVEQRIEENRYGEANELIQMLSKSLRRLPGVKTEIASITSRIKLLSIEYPKVKSDLKLLASKPSDKQANARVGLFYCLQKNDFEKGMPFLAKGTDGPLRALANDELSQKDLSTKESLKLADRWWELAGDEDLNGFKALAIEKYWSVVDKLQGLEKIEVQQRLIGSVGDGNPSSNTVALLTQNKWRIEWDRGTITEFYLTAEGAFMTNAEGDSFIWDYRVTKDGVETWDKAKTWTYIFTYKNGTLLSTKLYVNKLTPGVITRIDRR